MNEVQLSTTRTSGSTDSTTRLPQHKHTQQQHHKQPLHDDHCHTQHDDFVNVPCSTPSTSSECLAGNTLSHSQRLAAIEQRKWFVYRLLRSL
eukprot:2242624-Amphidinium_carterae.3